MENKIKFRTGFEFFEIPANNPGNGTAVPQYYLDKNTKRIKPVMVEKEIKDHKTGEVVKKLVQATHNLYDDIQKFKDLNDVKKYAEQVNEGIVSIPARNDTGENIDLTNLNSLESLYGALNKFNSLGITPDQVMTGYNQYVAGLVQSEKAKQEKKENIKNGEVVNEKETKENKTNK